MAVAVTAVPLEELAAQHVLSESEAQGVDPDNNRGTVELAQARGYTVQAHHVITADNYGLILHRLVSKAPANGKVVVLQHGLMDTSATWVLNEKTNSLGYILSDAGFDVWLANSRGNRYTAALDANKAWTFSFDEMAYYDIPAVVTYITGKTGAKKLSWVAHSQGCAISFAAFAKPGFSALIERFVALAPVTYLKTQSSPLMKIMVKTYLDKALALKPMKFVPSGTTLSSLLGVACNLVPGACDGVASGLFGCTGENLQKSRTGVYFAHFPDGTSTTNIVHWIQNARSGVFADMSGREFDLSAYAADTHLQRKQRHARRPGRCRSARNQTRR